MQARNSAHFAPWQGVLCALTVCGLLAACSAPAYAVPVTYSYGNVSGTTVDFVGIAETPTLASAPDQKAHFDPGPGPFGVPTGSGDSLLFNPTTFSLTSVDGASDSLDSQLSFEIHAKPGFSIEGFGLQESGDVFFLDATGASWAAVGAIINIVVIEIDGKAVAPIFVPQENAVFTPTGGYFAGAPLYIDVWSGSAYVDIGAFLGNLGNATKVSVSLDNTLFASSEGPGAQVTINKKLADGTGITVVTEPGNPIPEPSSLLLAALGCVGVGAYGMRRARRA